MMLPSWFARPRNVKVESICNEQKKLTLHTPSLAAKRCGQNPASFAKSWSLQRASSKAKGKCVPANITSICNDDLDLSISDEVSPCGAIGMQNLQDPASSSNDATTLLMHACAKLDPWDGNFISMSSCKRTSASLSCKELKALASKGHGVSDNDTEDFVLTSETRSSFCSETSLAESTISCKSVYGEKEDREEQSLQEGGVCSLSLGRLESGGGQDTCATKEQIVRRGRWGGRGNILFSYLTVRRRKSVRSKDAVTNLFDQKIAGRDSQKTSEACRYVENKDKEIVGKSSSASREEEKENWAVLGVKHYRDNAGTLDKAFEKSSTVGEANLNLPFDHGNAHRCTSSNLDTSSGDSLLQNVMLGKRCEPNCSSETQSTVASSTCCTSVEVAEETKGKVFSMRRRQRVVSISEVLPPDLQDVVGDSLALVKMSDNPYEDFRESIYEMIMEKDLEGSMDVEELLYCYLLLNAPEHHGLITEVFSDVWSTALMTF